LDHDFTTVSILFSSITYRELLQVRLGTPNVKFLKILE